ncbi:AMP-binding protein [bacterium]|nr:AMP-binding protein [bacterium]
MGVRDFTIYDFIQRNAQLYPDRDAIVFNDQRLSHKVYKERCDSLASGLSKAGIKLGDRLAVIAHNSDEFMILYGAAARIGAIILAINWRFQPEEVAYVLQDCKPRFVFAGADYQQTVLEIAGKTDFIEKCYSIGAGDLKPGFLAFQSLFADPAGEPAPDISADAGFVIIHTAAVEGHPRGALLSQANCIYSSLIAIHEYELDPDGCHICILPLFHVAGLNLSISMMHAGGKNVILERFDPELTLKAIEKEKGTVFFNFAPILGMLMDKYEAGSYDISSIRHLSGMDHPDNIKRFMKLAPTAVYHTGFAQTEAMGVSGCPITEKPGSAGKPTPLARVALFDDFDNEVPVGTPGEICVRSPTVFLGYWGLEAETAFTFRNGWHHTGDIGRFDEQGYLWYVKRKAQKELIKPGGENVYPIEVEKAVLDHPSIAEVVVIGVPDPKWGEAIKAVCVLKPGKSLDPKELIEFVGSKIARYKKPQQVVYVDSLPKTSENEIDRERVKKDHGAKY